MVRPVNITTGQERRGRSPVRNMMTKDKDNGAGFSLSLPPVSLRPSLYEAVNKGETDKQALLKAYKKDYATAQLVWNQGDAGRKIDYLLVLIKAGGTFTKRVEE